MTECPSRMLCHGNVGYQKCIEFSCAIDKKLIDLIGVPNYLVQCQYDTDKGHKQHNFVLLVVSKHPENIESVC